MPEMQGFFTSIGHLYYILSIYADIDNNYTTTITYFELPDNKASPELSNSLTCRRCKAFLPTQGTSITCYERFESKADSAQKPECT